MKLFKKTSIGFFIFIIIYILIFFFTPVLLDILDIQETFKMELGSIQLGEIVNNSTEMYGSITIFGILLSGLLGAMINIFIYYLIKNKV